MINYVFDIDGTLTPSRQPIDPEFSIFFLDFCKTHSVHLVTGSDREKTVAQLGIEILQNVEYCFNCCGNVVYHNNYLIEVSHWQISPEQKSFLLQELNNSQFTIKTGIHIEERHGLCNFSIVGRNANHEERQKYVTWDKLTSERKIIATKFEEKFIDTKAQIGGETGIDIFPIGKDKSQILKYLTGEIVFFGDACYPGGNDHSIAIAVEKINGIIHPVSSFRETWGILRQIQDLKT